MQTRLGSVGAITAISSGLGAAIVAIASQTSGGDPAKQLAAQLGLGSGVILGAIVGGVLGLWLSLGGLPRAARFAGWWAAIALGVLLWTIGGPAVWVFDVVLAAVFGPSAVGLGPFIGIGILIAVVRAASGTLSSLSEDLFVRRPQVQQSAANPVGEGGPG